MCVFGFEYGIGVLCVQYLAYLLENLGRVADTAVLNVESYWLFSEIRQIDTISHKTALLGLIGELRII